MPLVVTHAHVHNVLIRGLNNKKLEPLITTLARKEVTQRKMSWFMSNVDHKITSLVNFNL